MGNKIPHIWQNKGSLPSRMYNCGFCGSPLASNEGYLAEHGNNPKAYLYLCHFCRQPTYFAPDGTQYPGVTFGDEVGDITDATVSSLYNEARRATSASCNTAAVLCCRKLLMHIAVAKGAEEGKSFASYVDFLAQKNFVPPDASPWVDHIREKANEANHEINIMKPDEAKELLSFLGMLLKIIYEFPATVRRKYPQKAKPEAQPPPVN